MRHSFVFVASSPALVAVQVPCPVVEPFAGKGCKVATVAVEVSMDSIPLLMANPGAVYVMDTNEIMLIAVYMVMIDVRKVVQEPSSRTEE